MRCSKNDAPVKDADTLDEATVWYGDAFYCDGCGHEVIVGFGEGRLAFNCGEETFRKALRFRRS